MRTYGRWRWSGGRSILRQLEKERWVDRLRRAGRKLLEESGGRENAERNWYIVYGEALAV
jgi:hypothetical protein